MWTNRLLGDYDHTDLKRDDSRLLQFIRADIETLIERAASPAEEVLASALQAPTALTIDESGIYFGEFDGRAWSLMRVPTAGGAKQSLASGPTVSRGSTLYGIDRMDLTPAGIYFSYGDYDVSRIEELSRSTAERRVLAEFAGGHFLGVFESDVFYGRQFCCLIRQHIEDGSGPVSLGTGLWPRSATRDGTTSYFVDYRSRNVFRVDVAGASAPEPVITNNGTEGRVYVNSTDVFVGLTGTVRHVRKSGGAMVTVVLPPSGFLRGVDDVNLYFTTEDGSLWGRPIEGNETATLLAEATRVDGRVISWGGFLFWLDYREGSGNAELRRLEL